MPAVAVQRVADEELLLGILGASAPGRSIHEHFASLERALLAVLGSMSLADTRILRRRLARGAIHDPLAEKISRLKSERRERILAFLREAPRRQATTGAARRPIVATPPVTAA